MAAEVKIGDRFNRLTVVSGPLIVPAPDKNRPNKTIVKYHCRCDCGNDSTVDSYGLRSGDSKSCGCLRSEKASQRAKVRNFRHGMAGADNRAPEYHIWHGIIQRCHNEKGKDYPRYGARGISVCDRWRSSFAAFLEDMGPRPSPKHQIERKDNDKGYEAGNCRWATAKEQAENRRSNVYLEHDGRRLTQMEWSRLTGIGVTTISYRLAAGWPVALALTKPTNYQAKAR
jgi:hypothetical protein